MKSISASARMELGNYLMYKDRAKELLGLNLPNVIVANAVGVSESQITQWLSEEEFSREVQEFRIANLAEAAGRDAKYNGIEDTLLDKLKEKLEGGLMFATPREILAAIRVINGAVRRSAPAEVSGASTPRTVLQLVLPESAEFAAKFVVNGQNQVLEVAGRPMATMNAKGVNRKLEELRKNAATASPARDADAAEAEVTLNNLIKLDHLPVAETL